MRKLFSLLAILSLVSGLAFAYDEGTNTHIVRTLGGPQDQPLRIYQLVRYSEDGPNGVGLSQGDVVVWDCVSDDGVSVNLVSTASSTDAVAGVVVGNNSGIYSKSIPTADTAGISSVTASTDTGHRNWGFIQVYGLHTTVNVSGGGAGAGSTIVASQIGRTATAATLGNGLTRTLGFAYDASEQGQSKVFISVE